MPAFLFALWASARVKSTFQRYEKQYASRGLTGQDVARRILNANGLSHIRIEATQGRLSDHYDPRVGVVRLSEAVYGGRSTASIGVAAHEVGHAIQHATGYAPLQLRNSIIPLTNLGSQLAVPLFLAGLLLSAWDSRLVLLAYVGLIGFGLSVVFQLLTLPTEFDASRRALLSLESLGILNSQELDGSRKVLRAAALTYVAALAVSLAQLLRLLFILAQNRSRD